MLAFHEATIITPINMVLVRCRQWYDQKWSHLRSLDIHSTARRTGKTVGHYGVVQNHAMAKAQTLAWSPPLAVFGFSYDVTVG